MLALWEVISKQKDICMEKRTIQKGRTINNEAFWRVLKKTSQLLETTVRIPGEIIIFCYEIIYLFLKHGTSLFPIK